MYIGDCRYRMLTGWFVGCPHSFSSGEEVLSDWDDSGDDDDAAAPLAEAVNKVKLDDEDHDDWEDRA